MLNQLIFKCYPILKHIWPFLIQTQAHSNMGQLYPDLTLCVCQPFAGYFFFFMTPQGTPGHSWQKAQIGFKAKLSRLKKWAIQLRTDGILCCGWFFFLLSLPSAPMSNPFPPFPSFCCVTVKLEFKRICVTVKYSSPWSPLGTVEAW